MLNLSKKGLTFSAIYHCKKEVNTNNNTSGLGVLNGLTIQNFRPQKKLPTRAKLESD